MHTLPRITNKQTEILELLYKYRFLQRIQIQKLLNHKDYKTINLWLRDLREKQYVNWIYSDHYLERTKPAIYYLANNGIRYLKTVSRQDENGETHTSYPVTELTKRYKEYLRSQQFIEHSLLIADCCLALKAKNTANPTSYSWVTEADYMDPDSDCHFLAEHETLRPAL